MSRVFTHTGTHQQTINAKGAPEAIFDLCHLTEEVKALHAGAVEELAVGGFDPACSLIFEAEQEERNVMSRPPKRIDEPFFGIKKILLGCAQGVGILAIVMGVYAVGLYLEYGENEVRAFTFTTLVVSNIAAILSNRSWTRNIFQILTTPNRTVKWVLGGAILFLALILNVPFLLNLFQFDRIDLFEALVCIAAGFLSVTWFEIYKTFQHGKRQTILQ
jgi:P-type Ca2+ transporter type 2C